MKLLNVLILAALLNHAAEAASPNMLEYGKEGVLPDVPEYSTKNGKPNKTEYSPEEKIFWQKDKNKIIYVGSIPGIYRICREASPNTPDNTLIYADKTLVGRLAATNGMRNCIDVGGKRIEIQRKGAVGVYIGETFQRLFP